MYPPKSQHKVTIMSTQHIPLKKKSLHTSQHELGYAAITSKPQISCKTTKISLMSSANVSHWQGSSICHSHSGSQAYKAATNCHHARRNKTALVVLALAINYFDPVVTHITD